MHKLLKQHRGALALLILCSCSTVFGNILTIEEISLNVKSSLNMQLARVDILLAKAELDASLSPLDTQLALSHSFESSHEPQSSTIEASSIREKTRSISIGINKMFSHGQEIDISMQSIDIESDSVNSVLPKRNQLAALFKINWPILAGHTVEENLAKNLQAPFKIKRFENKLIETFSKELKDVYELYWKTFLAKEEIIIRKRNIKVYEKLVTYYKKGFKLGTKGKLKLLEVTSLLEKESTLVLLKLNKKNTLLLKINNLLNGSYVDIDSKTLEPRGFIFLQRKIKVAGHGVNSKIIQSKMKLEELRVDSIAKRNGLLPDLDINFEYLSTGLAKKINNSLKNVSANDFPNFTIGISFNWSFGNNYKTGQYISKNSELKRKQNELIKQKKNLRNDLTIVSNEINSLNVLYTLFLERKKILEKELKIRRRMYKYGRISVIEFEEVISRNTEDYIDILKTQVEILSKKNNMMILVDGYKDLI